MKKSGKLILVRHGASVWNDLDICSGWVDIPLSIKGIEEAQAVGKKIADIPIDVIFTSALIRTQQSAMLAMLEHKSGKIPCIQHPADTQQASWSKIYGADTADMCIPTYEAWQLNERMYGQLQGKNKQKLREIYGSEQVHKWRRSYAEAPPEGESLQMTAARTVPFFNQHIVPYVRNEQNVLVVAHGNSLRSIIMELEKLSSEQVVSLEIATGSVLIYCLYQEQWVKDDLSR